MSYIPPRDQFVSDMLSVTGHTVDPGMEDDVMNVIFYMASRLFALLYFPRTIRRGLRVQESGVGYGYS